MSVGKDWTKASDDEVIDGATDGEDGAAAEYHRRAMQTSGAEMRTLRSRLQEAERERDGLRVELASAERAHAAHHEHENAEIKRLEAALGRARELLTCFVRMLPRSLDMGRLPFAQLHEGTERFLADPSNTPAQPKEPGGKAS